MTAVQTEEAERLLKIIRERSADITTAVNQLAELRNAQTLFRVCARCGFKFDLNEYPRPVTVRGTRLWECPGCKQQHPEQHLKLRVCSLYYVTGLDRAAMSGLTRDRTNLQATEIVGRTNEWYLYYTVRSGSTGDFKKYMQDHGGTIRAMLDSPFWPADELPV